MYQFADRLHTLYELLSDEQSKEIFLARFGLDMDDSISKVKRLVSLGCFKDWEFMGRFQPMKDELRKLNRANKKIILYGAGETGKLLAGMLQLEHIDFYGFCGNDAEKFPDGLCGKPILSPDELIAHGDEYYVVLAVGSNTYPIVSQFLQESNYPKDHILDWIDVYVYDVNHEKQYLEFPSLYRRGTAFLDCGSANCMTSYRFAEWCEGAYSSIIAFEPDPDNYAKCCKMLQDAPLPNVQLVNAGLSSQEGTVMFSAQHTGSSHTIYAEPPSEFNFVQSEVEDIISIRTVAIDDVVGDRTVGFIKMDIEGSELDALHGAKNTILRDKPLLAVSVYHLRGDVFAIMDYLNQLLPEYRFYLRHYSSFKNETVLYASVDL